MDHPTDNNRWEALARYLAGESSPEEAARIQRLLTEEPERAKAMQALAAMMRRLELPPAPPVDVDAAWERTRARMHQDTVADAPASAQPASPAPEVITPAVAPTPPAVPEPVVARAPSAPVVARMAAPAPSPEPALPDQGPIAAPAPVSVAPRPAPRPAGGAAPPSDVIPLRPRRSAWWLVGAAAAAIIGVVSWQRMQRPATAESVLATAVGGRDSLVYADGSRILLGPASRLVVRAQPGERPESVTLEGEAYFDLPHDPARPFRVQAGSSDITDIGTRFTVRQPAAGPTVVEVHAGSVAFGARGATPLVLAAGEQAVRRGAAPPERLPGAAGSEPPAWTAGQLAFSDAGFDTVQDALRRWYGVELLADDSALAARHFTASFAGEPREEVVRILALTVGAEVAWQGDTARLVPAPDPRPRP
jgi:transmembrane sensor